MAEVLRHDDFVLSRFGPMNIRLQENRLIAVEGNKDKKWPEDHVEFLKQGLKESSNPTLSWMRENYQLEIK